jgi:ketosteroid isomerase-like protein
MPGESTTPDLVALGREAFRAINRRDFDAVMSLYAPGAVWVAVALGVDYNGVAAIRDLYEEFIAAFEDYALDIDEILDLGNGVGFAVIHHRGRPVGGEGYVQMQEALVTLWTDGLIVRAAGYLDVDDARAAAERLAEQRR